VTLSVRKIARLPKQEKFDNENCGKRPLLEKCPSEGGTTRKRGAHIIKRSPGPVGGEGGRGVSPRDFPCLGKFGRGAGREGKGEKNTP